jgi:tetratricopeptide (TPR) repeat protein
MSPRWRFFLCLLILPLLGGAEQAPDWLQRGWQAHQRGDFRAALDCYAKALPLSTEPGQVSFQQAAAYAALEEDEQAAAAYQRCLEDAQGTRRMLALYGRGNALAQVGNRRQAKAAVTVLRQSLAAYEKAQATWEQLSPGDREQYRAYQENIEYNQALVRTLLAQKEKEAENQPDEEPPNQRKPGETDNQEPTPGDQNRTRPDSANKGENTPQVTNQQRPGRGQLPQLLDDPRAAPLTAEQAQEYLRQTMERLQHQRGGQGSQGTTSGAKDW